MVTPAVLVAGSTPERKGENEGRGERKGEKRERERERVRGKKRRKEEKESFLGFSGFQNLNLYSFRFFGTKSHFHVFQLVFSIFNKYNTKINFLINIYVFLLFTDLKN